MHQLRKILCTKKYFVIFSSFWQIFFNSNKTDQNAWNCSFSVYCTFSSMIRTGRLVLNQVWVSTDHEKKLNLSTKHDTKPRVWVKKTLISIRIYFDFLHLNNLCTNEIFSSFRKGKKTSSTEGRRLIKVKSLLLSLTWVLVYAEQQKNSHQLSWIDFI